MQKINMNQQIIVLLAYLIDYEKLIDLAPDWKDVLSDNISIFSDQIADSEAINADMEIGRAMAEAERLTKIEFVSEWLAKLTEVPINQPASAQLATPA